MARDTDPHAACPVSRAICVFQEKWVLHILHTLLDGPRGFNELGRDVGGCNPTTLAGRLGRLEELGLVARSTEGGRSLYALTPAGEALRDVIGAIRAWSASHLAEEGAAPDVTVEVPATAGAPERHEGRLAPASRPVVPGPVRVVPAGPQGRGSGDGAEAAATRAERS